MKTRFHSSLMFSLLAISLVGAADSYAAGKSMTATKDAFPQTDPDAPITGLATVYSTGFEAGWALGPVEPQNGFTASGVNSPFASINASNACEGTQQVRIVRDAAAANGTNRLVLSPTIAQPANTPSQVKLTVRISNDQGADYDVFGQAPSQAFISWRVKFHFDDTLGGPGMIFVLDDIGAGLQFIGTGVSWVEGACAELKVQFDPAAGEIRYFYQGVHIYSGILPAGTAVEQVGWIADNWQLAGETADFDALNWIDTPSDPVPADNVSWGRIKNQYR